MLQVEVLHHDQFHEADLLGRGPELQGEEYEIFVVEDAWGPDQGPKQNDPRHAQALSSNCASPGNSGEGMCGEGAGDLFWLDRGLVAQSQTVV